MMLRILIALSALVVAVHGQGFCVFISCGPFKKCVETSFGINCVCNSGGPEINGVCLGDQCSNFECGENQECTVVNAIPECRCMDGYNPDGSNRCTRCTAPKIFNPCPSFCPQTCDSSTTLSPCPLVCRPNVNCICPPGYVEKSTTDTTCVRKSQCSINDKCRNKFCFPNSKCVDGECVCNEGYQKVGNIFCVKKRCPRCPRYSRCINSECVCNPGYVFNSGKTRCVRGTSCPAPKEATSCAVQCPATCDNPLPKGSCTITCNTNKQCVCPRGMLEKSATDSTCVRPDDCNDPCADCPPNSVCSRGTCLCNIGFIFQGGQCVPESNPCSPNPCQNGGRCNGNGALYSCTCRPGWTGRNCETRVHPCDSNPCQNGGRCNREGAGYSCTCIGGWTGTNCQTRVHPCETNPCQNGGRCIRDGSGYTCRCAGGWTGTNCQTKMHACDSSPCLNGGRCNKIGDAYTCTCTRGWTGRNCETPDPCASCGENEVCTRGKCECDRGFLEIDGKCVDPCANCPENSVCDDGMCRCRPGYVMKSGRCVIESDPCDNCPPNSRCRNGGCECLSGFRRQGSNCVRPCVAPKVYAACATSCPETCSTKGLPFPSPINCKPCRPNVNCVCPSGWVERNFGDSTCVRESDCPSISADICSRIRCFENSVCDSKERICKCKPGYRLSGFQRCTKI